MALKLSYSDIELLIEQLSSNASVVNMYKLKKFVHLTVMAALTFL